MFPPVLFYSFCSILLCYILSSPFPSFPIPVVSHSTPLLSASTPYRSFETCHILNTCFFAQTFLNSPYSCKTQGRQNPEVRRIYSGFSSNLFFLLRTFASQFLLRIFVRFIFFAPGSVRYISFCWDVFFPDLIRLFFFCSGPGRFFIPDFLLIYFLWSGMHANAKSGVVWIFSGFYSIFFPPQTGLCGFQLSWSGSCTYPTMAADSNLIRILTDFIFFAPDSSDLDKSPRAGPKQAGPKVSRP